MGFKEIVCEGVDWTDLTQDRNRWWTAVNSNSMEQSPS